MKDIGRTNEGNYIVEMIKEEYAQLCKLSAAVEGKHMLPGFSPEIKYYITPNFDFSKTFDVILVWYTAKMRVNNIQELLNDIKRSLDDSSV